ncbi:MAG: sulfurtransferase TusA family protein [Egibacteraceae bacterium]
MREPTVVDSLGKACPMPVIELAKAIARIKIGDEVLALSDDLGSKVDIPVWCRMKGQELVNVEPAERGWSFLVRRAQ